MPKQSWHRRHLTPLLPALVPRAVGPFLCLRYLRKRRIALFPVAAVTLCVALLIVITSLFHGFVDSYQSYRARVFGEIVLAPSREMAHHQQLAQHLQQLPSVAHAAPVAETGALLYLGRGDVRAVQLLGIDLAARCRNRHFRSGLLLQAYRPQDPTFDLPHQTAQAARAWLSRKLRREITDSQLPVGAVLGIGLLAQPDELTDEYDTPAIIEQLRQRTTGLTITTGKVTADPDSQAAAVKRSGTCWPVDVVQTGLHEADTKFVYLPFDYVASLIGAPGPNDQTFCRATVQITAAPGCDPPTVIADVRRAWRQFAADQLAWSAPAIDNTLVISRAETAWAKLFTQAIRKQLSVQQMMLGLIWLVVVTLVFVVLVMIVTQKRRDVGIIRSLGTSRWGVAWIFLNYGAVIGFTGALLGLILGVLATRNINTLEAALSALLGFKVWKSGVYMFQHIPNQVAWNSIWWIMLAGVVASLVGALLPALRAARMHPAAALRYE